MGVIVGQENKKIVTWPDFWEVKDREAFKIGAAKCAEYLKNEELYCEPSHSNPYEEESVDWFAWNRGWNHMLRSR